MQKTEMIALDCPCCGQAIYRPLGWFKQTYFTCPACDRGLAAGQFAPALEAVERELDAVVEELVRGEEDGCGCGGCGKHAG